MRTIDNRITPGTQGEQDDEIDVLAYLRIVRKRLWIVLAVLAVGTTAAVLYTLRQPKVYRATASLRIDPQPPQVFGSKVQEVIQLGAGSYWSNQEYYNTQVQILRNYELARLTVETNGLHNNPKLLPPKPNETRTEKELIDAAGAKLATMLSSAQKRESRIVTLSVSHRDPKFAVELANKHVRTFLAFTKGLRSKGSGDVSKFLSQELDVAEKRLRKSEKDLYKFRAENDILSVSLEDKQNILARDIARYTAALSDARIKRIELGAIRARAQRLKGIEVLESPIFALSENRLAASSLKQQYIMEKKRMAELQQELGPKHPQHQNQAKRVAELYASLKKTAKLAMREIDERHAAAWAAEARFRAEVERLKKEAFALGPKAVAYNRIKRQKRSDEENYNLVLGRLRASELTGRNEQTNVSPHASARGAVLVSPRLRLNVAVAFMLSLILGIGMAFLLEFMDRTIKSAEDIERTVGAPLLGIIPVVEELANATGPDAQRDRDLWVFENPTSRAAECTRSIRTNILFSAADRSLKTLTISSPRPREGKTTSTIYLGTTMAQSGQKVLLVDTDMRRPRLHKSLGVPKGRGISNVILGDSTLDDVIKTTDVPGLFLLPCGPQPPNPAELLHTKKFTEVLRDLEDRFDWVLLDSPPLLAVTDAVVLTRLSDGVILVAQAGKTLTDDIALATRQLRDVDAPILGAVLNDMDLSDRRYGYYYYQYGYGNENDGKTATNSEAKEAG